MSYVYVCACVCVRACACACVFVGVKKGERSGRSKERWGRVRELDGLLSASHFTR